MTEKFFTTHLWCLSHFELCSYSRARSLNMNRVGGHSLFVGLSGTKPYFLLIIPARLDTATGQSISLSTFLCGSFLLRFLLIECSVAGRPSLEKMYKSQKLDVESIAQSSKLKAQSSQLLHSHTVRPGCCVEAVSFSILADSTLLYRLI